jgi:hypothetical protein
VGRVVELSISMSTAKALPCGPPPPTPWPAGMVELSTDRANPAPKDKGRGRGRGRTWRQLSAPNTDVECAGKGRGRGRKKPAHHQPDERGSNEAAPKRIRVRDNDDTQDTKDDANEKEGTNATSSQQAGGNSETKDKLKKDKDRKKDQAKDKKDKDGKKDKSKKDKSKDKSKKDKSKKDKSKKSKSHDETDKSSRKKEKKDNKDKEDTKDTKCSLHEPSAASSASSASSAVPAAEQDATAKCAVCMRCMPCTADEFICKHCGIWVCGIVCAQRHHALHMAPSAATSAVPAAGSAATSAVPAAAQTMATVTDATLLKDFLSLPAHHAHRSAADDGSMEAALSAELFGDVDSPNESMEAAQGDAILVGCDPPNEEIEDLPSGSNSDISEANSVDVVAALHRESDDTAGQEERVHMEAIMDENSAILSTPPTRPRASSNDTESQEAFVEPSEEWPDPFEDAETPEAMAGGSRPAMRRQDAVIWPISDSDDKPELSDTDSWCAACAVEEEEDDIASLLKESESVGREVGVQRAEDVSRGRKSKRDEETIPDGILDRMLAKLPKNAVVDIIYKIERWGGLKMASMFSGAATDLVAGRHIMDTIGMSEMFQPSWCCENAKAKQAYIADVAAKYICGKDCKQKIY